MIEPTKESISELADTEWQVCDLCGIRSPKATAQDRIMVVNAKPSRYLVICDKCRNTRLGELAGKVRLVEHHDRAD